MKTSSSYSLIIPVLNEYHALTKLIPLLLKDARSATLEIIICDGGSVDLSAVYVKQLIKKHPDLAISFAQSQAGRAIQMNTGAALATYQTLVFLHADTVLPNNWYDLIKGKSWGRFNVSFSGRRFIFRIIETMMNVRSCWTQVATGDQAIFVEKTLFDSVGGYPKVALMEDLALSKRLRKKVPISCIKAALKTSSRRWEKNGVLKTVAMMWRLRWAYYRGVDEATLAKIYYPNLQKPRQSELVQVFSKLPILGYVKTRLIPQVGEQAATEIHCFLLMNALKILSEQKINYELWIAKQTESDGVAHEFLKENLKYQQGADLGERMATAIQLGLKQSEKVLLMGTDCLDFNQLHIQYSMNALEQFDVVLMPVTDGGFIAIACRVFDERFFQGIAWGSELVLQQLLHNLKSLEVSYHLLDPIRDIDTFEDVKEYNQLMDLVVN
ncbi:MAG: TIGR04283 family arsenosugar biosynthesis glycosyltransferase [Gammaproteobacteria bacterium]|nr:TIGR04283 family arsenosugar biosynthesis glycosyltransferase [Gammaproteobacteria bacterium]